MNEQESYWEKYQACWEIAEHVKTKRGGQVQEVDWLAAKYWEDFISGCERLGRCSLNEQELVDSEAPIGSKVEGV